MNTKARDPATCSPLLTDLYQLTMLDAYYQLGMEQPAVFEFFVRRLPTGRNFLVAAGLEQALDYLENVRFGPDDLAWLKSTGRFSSMFLDRLAAFRFQGDVMAIPEGTVFFASEPVLRVTASLPEAQLIESRLINLLQFQTLIASKAARCRLAAGSARLIDFGMRRAHGAEAACLASRASYIAGVDATATVEAGRLFGIPLAGTMAHSFIQAHDTETLAFSHFAQCRPDNVVLLIDTYDTERGAKRVAALSRLLRAAGIRVQGVRIDSGDSHEQACRVRRILDDAGGNDIQIYVSGNLDENNIAALRRDKAPIDAFCVGTHLSTSYDAPALDCAYKLNQYAGKPRRKRSAGKETWPGPRAVYRQTDAHGQIATDWLTCADETIEGRALLHTAMIRGQRCYPPPALDEVRAYCRSELQSLPEPLRTLEVNRGSPVKVSQRQHQLAEEFDLYSAMEMPFDRQVSDLMSEDG